MAVERESTREGSILLGYLHEICEESGNIKDREEIVLQHKL